MYKMQHSYVYFFGHCTQLKQTKQYATYLTVRGMEVNFYLVSNILKA